MANSKSTLAKLRAIGAEIPDYAEGNHFGSIALKAGKKMFATYSEASDELVVQLEPEHFDALTSDDRRFCVYPRARHCVEFKGSDVSDKELKSLLMESYALSGAAKKPAAKAKKPAKKSAARSKPRASR